VSNPKNVVIPLKKTVKINVRMSAVETCRKWRICMASERCRKGPGRLKLEGVRGIIGDWRQGYAAKKVW